MSAEILAVCVLFLLVWCVFMSISAVSERADAFVSKVGARFAAFFAPVIDAVKLAAPPIIAATKRIALAAWSAAVDLFLEYAPILRSRTNANATLLKVLGVFGWVLPATAHNWIVTSLALTGMAITFANVVLGRMRATGPIVTPRDQEGAAAGPGAEAERSTFHQRTTPEPRTF